MKITIVHPDSEESHIRLSERKKITMSALFKRLPQGTVIKRLGRTVDVAKECLISKVFTHDDVIEAVYTLVRRRRLWNGVKRSTQPCMITLDAVEKRAEMPCGHAITPQALYDYCLYELEKGKSAITCPYVTNIEGDQCGCEWNERTITLCAVLSVEEKSLFQSKLHINTLKQQEIESTNVYPDDVIISLLHDSPKTYNEILKLRACPKCWSIIEHMGGCLSMTCQYQSCGFHFCFRCLDKYQQSFNHGTCPLAPFQFSSDC